MRGRNIFSNDDVYFFFFTLSSYHSSACWALVCAVHIFLISLAHQKKSLLGWMELMGIREWDVEWRGKKL